jgi:hypothetical protein
MSTLAEFLAKTSNVSLNLERYRHDCTKIFEFTGEESIPIPSFANYCNAGNIVRLTWSLCKYFNPTYAGLIISEPSDDLEYLGYACEAKIYGEKDDVRVEFITPDIFKIDSYSNTLDFFNVFCCMKKQFPLKILDQIIAGIAAELIEQKEIEGSRRRKFTLADHPFSNNCSLCNDRESGNKIIEEIISNYKQSLLFI